MTDGGSLDEDGVVNGTIVDPITLAVPTVAVATLTDTGTNTAVVSAFAALLIMSAGLTRNWSDDRYERMYASVANVVRRLK